MARRLKPLTTKRIADLCERCAACRYWEEGRPAPSVCGAISDIGRAEEWFSTVREEWGDPGRMAYRDREALGMIKYAPSRYFERRRLTGSASASPDAVMIACMHVRPEARDIGLGSVLLQAAFADVRSRGELVVEAYGSVEPAQDDSPFVTANFLLRQGFQVVRPHPDLPLLRIELEALEAWTTSLEAALSALQPKIAPSRVPGTVPRPLGMWKETHDGS